MSGFPEAWLNELLSRTDIVSIVSQYVPLKPRGGRMWGCCPFHGEKTPSFSVSVDKQLFYCFGCHKGGSAIQFVMEMEKVPFREAVKLLAQQAGMELPEQADDGELQRERRLKERLYGACREAALFFHQQLKTDGGRQAQAYLARRGLQPQTVAAFGLGFAPAEWDGLYRHLKGGGYTEQEMQQAGLIVRSRKNEDRWFDMFRGRVIFPIIGGYQKVIGFGGRTMGDEQPKYLNTAETPIFNKRYNLYALNMLRGKNTDHLVLVEGYMDVVSLYQGGVTNAVATLGTALTTQQARLMKRYVSSVYVAYDGDPPGQKATLRALEILEAEGLSAKVIRFPGGKDPDEFIRAEGLEGYEALKKNALVGNAFRIEHMAGEYDLMSEDGREAFARKACAFIGGLSPVEQERYYGLLARKTGYSVDTLRSEGGRQSKGETRQGAFSGGTRTQSGAQADGRNSLSGNRNTSNRKNSGSDRRVTVERTLLKLALEAPGYLEKLSRQEELFTDEACIGLLQALLLAEKEGKKTGSGGETTEGRAAFLAALPENQAECAAAALSLPEADDVERCFTDCVSTLRRMDMTQELKRLQQEASEDGVSRERKLELLERIGELNEKLD